MTEKVHQAILKILADKRAEGEVLPYATSIEVASLLHISAREVERIAKKIEIERSKTIDRECYYE